MGLRPSALAAILAVAKPPALMFVFAGESNSGGYAVNADASSGELAARSVVQILNNTSLVFEDLDVGANNLIGHTGLTANATHGLEIGLANTIAAGRLAGVSQAYVVKAGQGGSTIAQWDVGNASGYWTTFLARINAAKALLADYSITPVVFYSHGINDAIAGTSVATWKAATIGHFAKIRAELGASTKIFMTAFEGPNMTARATYNTAMAEIAAADSNTGVLSTADLTTRDVNHWDYQGFLDLSERLIDAYDGASGTLSAPSFSPAAGTYISTQTVTITGTAGATIRYSVDGTPVTSRSPEYTAPLSVAASTTVRARQFRAGHKNSNEASAAYVISQPWITWVSGVGCAQSGDYLEYTSGSIPVGALSTTTIDATAPFAIEMDVTDSLVAAWVLYLDDENGTNFAWDGTNAYVAGMYWYGGVSYRSSSGGATAALVALTAGDGSRIRMIKSGNDVIYATSTDGGATWTDRATVSGALTGKTTLYVKALLAETVAGRKIRARLT